MTLYDEIYFEITASGKKSELEKFISFINGGGLDDFFEIDDGYIDYDDDYKSVTEDESSYITFSNDDIGIEVDEFDVDEFLEVICRAGRRLDLRGEIYDVDDDEYRFISKEGDSYYLNANNVSLFNDDLDTQAKEEDADEDEGEE
ncbi:MAG: hypothetical protein IKL79_04730 [Clostridia bacterium]|nr:hypothetical protein [Clostridia bacterium]